MLIFTFNQQKKMKKIYSILLLLISTISYSQINDTFYVDDVASIKYLTVNYSVTEKGRVKDIKLVPNMTTYENKNALKTITKYLKKFEYSKESELINDDTDFTFIFINKKFKNTVLTKSDYSECAKFKTGKFKYSNVRIYKAEVKRNKRIQREKSDMIDAKFRITWINPCEYELTFLKVKQKENKYLIGKTMKTEIIGLLSSSYIYKTDFLGITVIGELEKIK